MHSDIVTGHRRQVSTRLTKYIKAVCVFIGNVVFNIELSVFWIGQDISSTPKSPDNYLLTIYACNCTLVLLPALVRYTSVYGQQLIQGPVTSQSARVSDCWVLI